MYTEQDRDNLLSRIVEFVAGDSLFEGLVQIGSGANGYRDIYSDIDLMVGCFSKDDIPLAEKSLIAMFHTHGAIYIDHRRWSDTVLGLSAYWDNGLSVDLSFMPTEEIPIRSQRWVIRLSKTTEFTNAIQNRAADLGEQHPILLDNAICHKFLYALRRCEIATKRGEYIFADMMLAEARQYLLTMEAARCGKDLHQFKAYNSLPLEFMEKLEATYPLTRNTEGIVATTNNLLALFLDVVEGWLDFDRKQLKMIGWSRDGQSEPTSETDDFMEAVNATYYRLEMKQAQIAQALFHRIFEVESGWYSGHYHKGANGNWVRESYPIPVVEVKGLCDIEISFDKISVSTKFKRAKALEYSYDKISKYSFEAFGVDDYLCDFYGSGMTFEELKVNISRSEETEIGFTFYFPFEVEGKVIFEFVKLLRREGFYY